MKDEKPSRCDGLTPRSDRFPVTILVAFSDERLTGLGRIWEVSGSGARIEESDFQPQVGSKLTLAFAPLPWTETIELSAKVVRPTQTGGIAVEFLAMDSDAECGLLELLNKGAEISKSEEATSQPGEFRR
jgi:hypothetical protein